MGVYTVFWFVYMTVVFLRTASPWGLDQTRPSPGTGMWLSSRIGSHYMPAFREAHPNDHIFYSSSSKLCSLSAWSEVNKQKLPRINMWPKHCQRLAVWHSFAKEKAFPRISSPLQGVHMESPCIKTCRYTFSRADWKITLKWKPRHLFWLGYRTL